MFKKSLFILFLLLSTSVYCIENIRFKHITSSDGLSQSEVYCFHEDQQGYLWIGTVDGLNRYDGYNIKVFNTERNNPNSLPNNTVRSIVEDDFYRIWIGTSYGLCFYDMIKEKIIQLDLSEKCSSININTMFYEDGLLLLGTDEGAFKLKISKEINFKDPDIKRINISEDIVENNRRIVQIQKSNDNLFFVATPSSLKKMAISFDKEDQIIENIAQEIPDVMAVTENSQGHIWIATRANGVYIYTDRYKDLYHLLSSENGLSSQRCSNILCDHKDNIWVSTLNKGVNVIRSGYKTLDNIDIQRIENNPFDPSSLRSNLIYTLYNDRNNLLWIGTIGSGVSCYNPNQKVFKNYRIPPSSQQNSNSIFTRAVYVDKEGRIFMGLHGGGLYLLNKERTVYRKIGFGTESVYHIYPITDKKIAICTEIGLSIISYDQKSVKILQSLDTGAAFNLEKANKNNYWLGSINGLYAMELADGIFRIKYLMTSYSKPSISSNNCRVVHYDHFDKRLLVGTEGGGLNVLKIDSVDSVETIIHYKASNDSSSISNNFIRSIIQTSRGTFWIGTYEGLNRCTEKDHKFEFKTYTKRNGLPNNLIHSIVEDNRNNIWIGTNYGLSQLNTEKESFINYNIADGLQENEFSEHTVYKSQSGEIFFGGINGITAFFPDQIKASTYRPEIIITDLSLFNKRVNVDDVINGNEILNKNISFTDSIYLKANQNNIRINFTSMPLVNSKKVSYKYILEGYEDSWTENVSNNRSATYTNLRHGKYVFKAIAYNKELSSENIAKLFIHINTPFYLEWYAFLIYVLIIILIIVYFTNFSVMRYTTKKKILLENEHNAKIHELDLMRTRFFINVSHDLRTPLTLISAPVDNILKKQKLNNYVNRQLQLVKQNVEHLQYLIEQLLDIRKAEVGKLKLHPEKTDLVAFVRSQIQHFTYAFEEKNLKNEIRSDKEIIEFNFDKKIVSKVLFNLLSNAIKYTESGTISVEIYSNTMRQDGQFVKVSVKDTGIGIAQERQQELFERFYQTKSKYDQGYGIGLSHCKDLIEVHQGKIEIESNLHQGSTFSFYLPFYLEESNVKQETLNYNQLPVFPEDLSNSFVNDKSKYLVIVIEDNDQMRKFICSEINTKYRVLEASDGREGLNLIKKQSPDLIISDVMMPDMNGIELCKAIKTDIHISHIPVVLLTAKVEDESKYKGIETGADDYIAKPFSVEYLLIRIENLIKSREQLKQLFRKEVSLNPSTISVTSLDEEFISSLIKSIEKGIPDSEFSVNDLEKELSMSRASLYRKIKNISGMSAKELLQDMRMKRAHQLIQNHNDLRVSDVAYMVGFTSPKYFSKCFRSKYGLSPSDVKN